MSAYRNYKTTRDLQDGLISSVGDDTLDERVAKYGVYTPAQYGISYNHLGSPHFIDGKGRQYTPEHTDDDEHAQIFYVRLPKGITRKQNRKMSEGEPLYLDDIMDFPQVGEDLELQVLDLAQRGTFFRTTVSLVLDRKQATARIALADELPIVRSEREERKRVEKADRERDREWKKKKQGLLLS